MTCAADMASGEMEAPAVYLCRTLPIGMFAPVELTHEEADHCQDLQQQHHS